jgi:predicted nuclease of predicted toxin-antitoxin system
MRILVDENIPKSVVAELQASGHEVLDIRGTPKQGADDDQLWAIALAEKRLFITTDKGFANHRDESHFGVLIIRLRQPNETRIRLRIQSALNQFAADQWPGLTVVMRDFVQSVMRSH